MVFLLAISLECETTSGVSLPVASRNPMGTQETDVCIIICHRLNSYLHLPQELMKSVLFMMNVKVSHFLGNTHMDLTTLILVMLVLVLLKLIKLTFKVFFLRLLCTLIDIAVHICVEHRSENSPL